MSVLATYRQPQPIIAGTVPSAYLQLNVLRQNVVLLDMVTRRFQNAVTGQYGNWLQRYDINPVRIWWGGFRFRMGVTTLTIIIQCDSATPEPLSNDRARIYLNGLSGGMMTEHAIGLGTTTITRTISGLGFTDGQCVDVDVILSNTVDFGPTLADNENWALYWVRDAYIGPIGLSDAYPGVPTFAGTTVSSTNVQQLANAIDWIYRHMLLMDYPLFQSLLRVRPAYGDVDPDYSTWRGSVTRTTMARVLKVQVYWLAKVAGLTETVALSVNGSLIETWNVPNTAGRHSKLFTYTLTSAVGTNVPIIIVPTAGYPGYDPENRFSVFRVWLEAEDQTPISVPTSLAMRQSMTIETLVAWFASLASAVTTVKTRLDNNSSHFARQYLFTKRPVAFEKHNVESEAQYVASGQRFGRLLHVRGQNVKLAYIGQVYKAEWEEAEGWASYPWTTTYEESLIDGDDVETRQFYYDVYPALVDGTIYYVRGDDVRGAWEAL